MTEQKEKQGSLKPLLLLPTIPLLMLISVYAGQILQQQGLDLTKFSKPTSEQPVAAATIPESFYDQSPLQMIHSYLGVKRNLESLTTMSLSLDSDFIGKDKKAADFIKQRGRQHFLNGIAIVDMVLPNQDSTYINGNSVLIEGEDYDPDNLYQRSLGSAILDLRLQQKLKKMEAEEMEKELVERAIRSNIPIEELKRHYSSTIESDSSEPKIGLLKWLKQLKSDITVDDSAWGYLPEKYLVTMAQTLKTLDQHELPLPDHTRFMLYDNSKPFGGWYEGHNYAVPFTITVTSKGSKDTYVHEAGHFLSDAWAIKKDPKMAEKMKPFSQKEFTESVWPNQKKDPEQTKEEYAEAVRAYLIHGYQARRESRKDPIENNKYQFMKKLFAGTEFSGEMKPITLNPDLKEGTKAKILDKDTDRPGVLLRPDPRLRQLVESELGAVYDGEEVGLWDKQIVDFSADKAYIFWKITTKTGRSGWVDERWLTPALP